MLATRAFQTSASVKDVETAAKFIGAGAATVGCAGKILFQYLSFFRAQNNGRSPDNDRPKMPLDWSLFYLTGHFDRPHLYAFR